MILFRSTNLRKQLMLGVFTALIPVLVHGLPGDEDQPIRIQSNSAEIDDNKGVSIYRGEVNVLQGSIRLLADEVVVHNSDKGISKVVATGNPAHYQQQRETDTAVTNAYGNIVEYRVIDQFIRIHKNARLEEDGNSFSGERIDYDMKNKTVKAFSDSSAPNGNKNSRVEIVIQPKAAQDEEQTETLPDSQE